MNIFKKISLYRSFSKILELNKVSLEANFNMKIDYANRIYTVVNVPIDSIGEPYNLRKSDIDTISEKYLKEYISKSSEYLNSIGLVELYGFYEPIKKVDKYSYLIILGYKHMNSVSYTRTMITLFSITLLSSIIFLIRFI